MIKNCWLLCIAMIPPQLLAQAPIGNSQANAVAVKWKTTGLRQANSMGGGEAAIPKSGKFRVFVLEAIRKQRPIK